MTLSGAAIQQELPQNCLPLCIISCLYQILIKLKIESPHYAFCGLREGAGRSWKSIALTKSQLSEETLSEA